MGYPKTYAFEKLWHSQFFNTILCFFPSPFHSRALYAVPAVDLIFRVYAKQDGQYLDVRNRSAVDVFMHITALFNYYRFQFLDEIDQLILIPNVQQVYVFILYTVALT